MEHNVILGGLTISAGVLANRNTGLDEEFRFYPGIDISYRPESHWKIYASWNNALRVPTYTDLYTSNAAQQGDIGLKPENNSTYKVGARYRAKWFTGMATAFYSHGTNMIDWVYETATSSKYQAMNIGKLDNLGFNIEGTANLNEMFRMSTNTQPVMLKLSYAIFTSNTKPNAKFTVRSMSWII